MLCRRCLREAAGRSARASSTYATSRLTSPTPSILRPLPATASARISLSHTVSPPQRFALWSNARTYTTSTSTAESPDAATTPEKPDYLNEAESTVWDMLVAEFAPAELVVQDISGGCGSMYGIEISSEKFRGANMLKQQRMVNAVLGDLMKEWHGVQLKTRVP